MVTQHSSEVCRRNVERAHKLRASLLPRFNEGDRAKCTETGRTGTVQLNAYGPGPTQELVLWDGDGATYWDDDGNPLPEHVLTKTLRKI